MKNWLYILIPTLLFSCNNKDEKKEANEPGDTLAIENKTIEASFDDKLFKTLSIPLNIDTVFVMKVDTNDRIPYQQIRQLGTNFLDHEFNSGSIYDINKFCEIDSLKQEDKYKEYVEKLDIGMTKQSIAYKIGVATFDNGSKLFLWGITNNSYEACPFFSETQMICTFVNEDNQNTHFVVAGRSGGGDPPAMMNETKTAKINPDGKIEIEIITVNDDLDIPGKETTRQSLILKAEKDKIKVIDFKKEVKSTEKSN